MCVNLLNEREGNDEHYECWCGGGDDEEREQGSSAVNEQHIESPCEDLINTVNITIAPISIVQLIR
jgi:hypothetical protein